jgi:hypothetical protein
MSSKSYSRKQRGSITIEKEPAQNFYLLLIIGWFTIIRSEAQAAAAI